jgi:glyoxylase-like metal-dependent hydrolase (beta-lactamase superfamily II)
MEIITNVHLIPGIVATPYLLIDPDGLTLIDAGLPRNHGKILKYLASLGYAPSDLKRILITHADGDHYGSLAALRKATQARTFASAIEAQAIAAGRMSRPLKLSGIRKILFSVVMELYRPKPVQVDEILAGGQELPVLGGLRVIETPGHTPGHLSFFAPSPAILFSGDSLFCTPDRIEPSRGVNTWDETLAKSSAKIQAGLGAKIVCPGHGPVLKDAAALLNVLGAIQI